MECFFHFEKYEKLVFLEKNLQHASVELIRSISLTSITFVWLRIRFYMWNFESENLLLHQVNTVYIVANIDRFVFDTKNNLIKVF